MANILVPLLIVAILAAFAATLVFAIIGFDNYFKNKNWQFKCFAALGLALYSTALTIAVAIGITVLAGVVSY